MVVTSDGASAVIERAPLRIAFLDGGEVRLQQVANERAGPSPIPPVPDPEPLGGDNVPRRPSLYAPLTFTVGVQRGVEFPLYQYNGNLLTGVEGGVQHAAHDVESVAVEGDSARLVVGTSDAGRKLEVVVGPGPAGRDATRRARRVTPGDGVVAMADSFATAEGEAVPRLRRAPQPPRPARHRVLQLAAAGEHRRAARCSRSSTSCPGTEREQYLFPTGPHSAYYVQSQFFIARLRLPARPARAVAVAHGGRPRRRVAGVGRRGRRSTTSSRRATGWR